MRWGCRGLRCAPARRGAAGLPQQRRHHRVGCGRGQPIVAMLGGNGSGSSGQCASAEPLIERREIVSDGGRCGRQRRGASEPAPGHERRPVTGIEPPCFGGRRTSERRYSDLDITGQCHAVFSRLMCLGVHPPPCPSRSFAPWVPGPVGRAHVTRIPSDSRHLLGLGQVLLRRGKQIFGAGASLGGRQQDRAQKSPMPQDPKPLPFPLGAPALCSQWPGPSATLTNVRLRTSF
jgi:hypothetical protein